MVSLCAYLGFAVLTVLAWIPGLGFAGRQSQGDDALAMTIYLLSIAALAFLVSNLAVRVLFRPLGRLESAIAAIAQSASFPLPGAERGEFAGISHALAALARKMDASRERVEEEVEERTRMLGLTAGLCEIYAKDATETATVAAVNMLERSFRADSAVLFYVAADKEHRYCLAGTSYPIALPENRWRECVRPHGGKALIARFGPWSPPGLERPLASWISYRLYAVEDEDGYIFLGRANGYWSMKEEADLVAVAEAITPIVKVRREREFEERTREEAETRLAANEKRLRTFLEGSRDMIYTADSEDLVTDINAAGIGLLKRTGREEIVGRPYSGFALNAEDRRLLLARVREVGYAADYEIVLRRADGSGVFCLETAYAIRDPDGKILELQGIVKDISERISNESALWKSSIELADANLKFQRAQALMVQHEKLASIGQLAAGVAHEINNPLGFLKSNQSMIEKYVRKIVEAWEEARNSPVPDLPEVERRFNLSYLFTQINAILVESDEGFGRIMHIVGNLKSFSRTELGAEYGPYDVNAGIESTSIVARNEIKYVADVRMNLGELPPVRARGSEINQVLLNILVNAAQAIEGQKRKEKGLIEIRTANLGDRVLIGIRDDGPGIPENLRTKVFDPFFTTKEPGKGTGLGLSISYDIIVTKHEGRLSVDCAPEGGTTFTIELPIAGPKQGDEAH